MRILRSCWSGEGKAVGVEVEVDVDVDVDDDDDVVVVVVVGWEVRYFVDLVLERCESVLVVGLDG